VSHSRTVRFVTLAALAAAGCDTNRALRPASREAPAPAATQAPAGPSLTAQQQDKLRSLGYTAPAAGAPATEAAQAAAVRPAGLEAMAAARKLIRTGQITLVVDTYVKAADAVKRIAEAHGGYLADTQAQRGDGDRRHGAITIRVAAERFDEAVEALRTLGDVRSENVSAQDVTKAYADLETRLLVKRETADRLRDILRTRTARLSDVLEAERELARVTEEIEQMEGERRFYDQQVAMSTLTVTLQEPSAVVEASVFTPVTEALRDSVRVLAASVAAIVYLAVFLGPWLVLAFLGWKLFRRLRARRTAVEA
jgi:hypothetical protein